MNQLLLLCDWGNSSFRLSLYNTTAGKLINEVQSTDGIGVIYRALRKNSPDDQKLNREVILRNVLLQQVAILAGKTNTDLKMIPIVISGMASSSIGIADLPYADLPFSLNGGEAKTMHVPATAQCPHAIVLISGVQGNNEVMRGEETQMVGLWSLLANTSGRPDEVIVILPGTHSKHIFVRNNQMIHFSTFMTGELYQLLATHSILKNSVNINETADLSGANEQAFRNGLQHSQKKSFLNALFTVRTNQLFKRWNEMENSFFLSGLLIGSELQNLRDNSSCPIMLCSGKNLNRPYTIALQELELTNRTSAVAVELVEQAAMAGQQVIFNQLLKRTVNE